MSNKKSFYLNEISCEFQFEGDYWNYKGIDKMYEEFKDEFPQRMVSSETKALYNKETNKIEHVLVETSEVSFYNKDMFSSIIVEPNHLIVILKWNNDWLSIKKTIIRAFEVYKKFFDDPNKGSILRTIAFWHNYYLEYDFKKEKINIKHYLKFYPVIPKGMEGDDGLFSYYAPKIIKGGEGYQEQIILSLQRQLFGVIVFSIGYARMIKLGFEMENLDSWFEDAHNKVSEIFSLCAKKGGRKR